MNTIDFGFWPFSHQSGSIGSAKKLRVMIDNKSN